MKQGTRHGTGKTREEEKTFDAVDGWLVVDALPPEPLEDEAVAFASLGRGAEEGTATFSSPADEIGARCALLSSAPCCARSSQTRRFFPVRVGSCSS